MYTALFNLPTGIVQAPARLKDRKNRRQKEAKMHI